MTTIVWKPGYLAADRQTTGEILFTGPKLKRHYGKILASAGNSALGLALEAWYINGANPENFPEQPGDLEDGAELIVVEGLTSPLLYSSTPCPETYEMPFMAFGSGGNAAMAALMLGATIQEAISVAAEIDVYTGQGIDIGDLTGTTPIIHRHPLLLRNEHGLLLRSSPVV